MRRALVPRELRTGFDRAAVLVATSNYPLDGLLPDPRHHALVLPLVAALEASCEVVQVAAGSPSSVLDAELTDRARTVSRLHLLARV